MTVAGKRLELHSRISGSAYRTERINYTFIMLRYIHDITSGEFVNVGVALHAPKEKFLQARMRTTYARVCRFFPGLNRDNLKRVVTQIDDAISRAATRMDDLFPETGSTVIDFASRILPRDDSALQWSKLGSGQTRDPARELDVLFDRLVLRHEITSSRNARQTILSLSTGATYLNLA